MVLFFGLVFLSVALPSPLEIFLPTPLLALEIHLSDPQPGPNKGPFIKDVRT